MKWIKGYFYPDYQTAICFSPIDIGQTFLSWGRFNYEFANGPQSYFFIEGGTRIFGKCHCFQWHWHIKLSKRNINHYILTRKYGRSFTDN